MFRKSIFFALFICLIVSCKNNEANQSKTIKIEDVKTTVEPVEKAPTFAPIFPNDYSEKLPDWVAYYQEKGFDITNASAFEATETVKVDGFVDLDYQERAENKEKYETFLVVSPNDENLFLDILGAETQIMQEDGEWNLVGQSPDSEVALVSKKENTKKRLLFCGTPCHFEEAFWKDDQTVVVAGYSTVMGSESFKPTIWVINLEEQLLSTFMHSGKESIGNEHNYQKEVKLKSFQ